MKPASGTNGHDGTETDEQVVRRHLAGDTGAAGILLDRYLPMLRSRVQRRLSRKIRRRVAESDVIQETYMAALNCLDEFEDRGEGSFKRWLNAILEHKMSDQVRRHVEARKRSTDNEETQAGSSMRPRVLDRRTPSMVAASNESVSRVLDALEGLSEDYRVVLELVHVRGLSLGEAGTAMDRSHGAMRMLYGRAVTELRMKLENGERR